MSTKGSKNKMQMHKMHMRKVRLQRCFSCSPLFAKERVARVSPFLGSVLLIVGCDPTGSGGSSKVIRQPGPPDPSQSTVAVDQNRISAGSALTAVLTLKDEGGMTVTAPVDVTFVCTGGGSNGTFSSMTKIDEGTYAVSFTGVQSGTPSVISAVVNSQGLTSPVPTVTVTPGDFSATHSTLTLSNSQILAGGNATLQLITKDSNGNLLTRGGMSFQLVIDGGTSSGQFGAVQDNHDGTYTIPFLGTTSGTVSNITAIVEGVPLVGSMQRFQVATDPSLFSLSNTTASVSSGSVVAGQPVVVSATAKDPYGNTLGGDLPVTFTSNPSIPNQQPFGTVNYQGSGTYQTTFTTTTAGTYAIQGQIGGTPLSSDAPIVTVNPGDLSLVLSSVSVSAPAVLSGATATVTLQARDIYGNSLGSGLSVALNVLPSSGGSIGPISYAGNGKYTATFTGQTTGYYTIRGSIGGSPLTSPAAQIAVDYGLPSPSQSQVTVADSNLAAGGTTNVSLTARDIGGNVLSGLVPSISFVTSPVGGGTFGPISYAGNGVYNATFNAVMAGSYSIVGVFEGRTPLTSTPPQVTITSGVVDATQSSLVSSSSTVNSGGSITLTVHAKDASGNLLGAGLPISCFLSPSTSGAGTFSSPVYAGSGIYTINFTARSTGTFAISCTVGATAVLSLASPVVVNVGPPSLSNSVVSVVDPLVVTGYITKVSLLAKDASGNALGSGLNVGFAVSPAGGGTFGNVTFANGVYTADFTAQTTGNYTIQGLINGSLLSSQGSAISITTRIASPVQTTITAASSTVTAGSSMTITVQARDANGNLLGIGLPLSFSTIPGPPNGGTFTNITYIGNGNYQVTFTGQIAGTYTLVGSVGGTVVTSSSPQVTINPGPPSVAQSQITLSSSLLAAGYSTNVNIQPVDANGNPVGCGQTVACQTIPANAGSFGPIACSGGTYTTVFSSPNIGSYSIQCSIGGNTITSSVPSIAITSATASPTQSNVSTSSSTMPAGASITVTLQARDADGNILGSGLPITFDTVPPLPGATYSNLTYSGNGNYTVNFTAPTSGTYTIVGTVGGVVVANSTQLTVNPGNAVQMVLASSSNATTAGTPLVLTVTLKDSYGNIASGYTRKVHFSSADSGAQLPGDYTFVPADGGVHVFSPVLALAGTSTITATDQGGIVGTSPSITVSPGSFSLARSQVSSPASVAVGSSIVVSLAAKDTYGNSNPTGINSVEFTASTIGGSGSFGTVNSSGGGVYTANFTGTGAGSVVLGAIINRAMIDGGAVTSVPSPASIQVTSTSAISMAVSGMPGSVTAGSPFSLTVAAKDSFGNIANSYSGTIRFTSGDPQAVLPPDYTFVASDQGQHTFNGIAFRTAGSFTITMVDIQAPSMMAITAPVAVSPAPVNTFAVSGIPLSMAAGTSFFMAVTAKDGYGNTATGYSGTVIFTSTDPQAVLPASYTFQASDQGVHTFGSNLLKTVGAQNITLRDSSSGISSVTTVSVGSGTFSLARSQVSSPAGVASGSSILVTLTAKDAFGNLNPSGISTVAFTSSSIGGSGTFGTVTNVGNGVFTANFTGQAAGQVTLGAMINGAIVTSTASPASIVVNSGTAMSLALSGVPSTVGAGSAFALTVTAKDSFGNPASGYTGTMKFTSNDALATLPASYTFQASDSGSHTFTGISFKTAGLDTLSVTDTGASALAATSPVVTVTASPAVTLAIGDLPSSISAGSSMVLVVTAKDAYGNTALGYTGTVQFTSNDGNAVLPANYTFQASDSGTHSFTAILRTAGSDFITASDTTTASIHATSSTASVRAGVFSLAQSQLTSADSVVAGASMTVTLTAKDAFGNSNPSGINSVSFTTSSIGGSGSYGTVVNSGNGVYTATFLGQTAGSVILGATINGASITSIPSPASVSVVPSAATTLAIGALPANSVAGSPFALILTAKDSFGNTATTYSGTIQFTSNDPQAVLPSNYTFAGSDRGVHVFSGIFKTAGTNTITIADSDNSSISTTSSPVAVSAAPAAMLSLAPVPSTTTAGTGFSMTVYVKDSYGNAVSGYTGAVNLTSTDIQAALPSRYTFSGADQGSHSFAVVLKTAGTHTVIVTDASNSAMTVTSSAITVGAGALSLAQSQVSSPATVVAGSSITVTLIAKDAYGNPNPSGVNQVNFTSSNGGGNSSGSGSGTLGTVSSSGLGVYTASFTGVLAGSVTLGATINGANVTSTPSPSSVTVTASSAATLALSGIPSTVIAGSPFSVVVTALDFYGNVATGYTGTVHFSSSDPLADLPANLAFSLSDHGVHSFNVTLKNSGSSALTVTDTSTPAVTATASGIPVGSGGFSLAQSQISSPSSVIVGSSISVTLTTKDAYGNPNPTGITSVGFTSSGTGVGSFGSVIPVDSGVYLASFTASAVGSVTLGATINGSNVTSTPSPGSITVSPAAATILALSGVPADKIAGSAFSITVTAKDTFGNTATGYTGTVKLTSSDPQAELPSNYQFTSQDAGVHSFTIKLKSAGPNTLTVTDTVNSNIAVTSPAVVVNPAGFSLTASQVSSPESVVQGASVSVTLTAKDAYGNANPTGITSVGFTQIPSGLPGGSGTFGTVSATGNGVYTAAFTGQTSGQVILGAAINGNAVTSTPSPATVNVKAGAAASLVLSNVPSGLSAGTAFTLTITAKDSSGNTATGYMGTIKFTSNDPQAVLPSNYTFQASDNGVHTFSGLVLKTSGVDTVTATDTVTSSLSGTSAGISVTGSTAATLAFSNVPSSAIAGATFALVTVTAKDAYGNTSTGYSGTVRFDSNDAQAVLPSDYTFQVSDHGAHTFSVILKTSGSDTISATDKANSNISATSSILITPAAFSLVQSQISSPGTVAAGSSIAVTLTARDPYGNANPTGVSTVALTYSSVGGSGSIGNVVAAGNGVYTASFTGQTAGPVIFAGSINGSSLTSVSSPPSVVVTADSAASFVLSGLPSSMIAGASVTLTVTAKDHYGNTATGYTGSIHFSSSDVQAVLPSNFTFQASDNGVHSFNGIVLGTVGSQTIAATDISSSGVTGSSSAVTVNAAAASSLALNGAPTMLTAGGSFGITVVAKDRYGNTAEGYTGTIRFTASDSQAVLPSNYSFVAADHGSHAFSAVAFKTVGPETLTASDTVNGSITGTSSAVSVAAAQATTLAISGTPSSLTAGGSLSLTVTAKDSYGNAATGYTGKIHFTSTDGQALLPSDYTFASSDQGIHAFAGMSLKTAGSQTITATDVSSSGIAGTSSAVTVNAGSATLLALSGPPSATAGSSLTLSVVAKDSYGNTAVGYTGTIHFAATDPLAQLPSNYTFVAQDNGMHSFSALLKTSGSNIIFAADISSSSITGATPNILVTSSTAVILAVSVPSSSVAGAPFSVTVTAKDSYGNSATGYTGTVLFSSTDGQAILPANYTFLSSDLGSHTFSSVVLKTVGAKTITATDINYAAITGTSSPLSVSSAQATTLATTGIPSSVTAGTSFGLTITARDTYGNISTGYVGTVRLSSNDSQAVLPANYTFTASDAGSHAFTGIALRTAGASTLTAVDTAVPTIATTPSGILVNPAQGSVFAIGGVPSTVAAGTSFNSPVSVKDAYGNIATGYTGKVHFTSSDARAVLPSDYTFVAADAGVHSFSIQFGSIAAASTFTITDNSSPMISATSSAIAVTTPALSPVYSTITLSSSSVKYNSTTPVTITLTAKDSSGNRIWVGGSQVVFSQSNIGQAGAGSVTINNSNNDLGNGTYVSSITPSAPGLVNFTTKVNGQTLNLAAPTLTVTGVNLEVPIEMLDVGVAAKSSVKTFEISRTNLDPTAYDGTVNYFFEIVAANNSNSNWSVNLVDSSNSIKAGIVVPVSTVPQRLRTSFVPNPSADQYRVQISTTSASDYVVVYSARILVQQINATKTKLYYPLLAAPYSKVLTSDAAIDTVSSPTYTQGHGLSFPLWYKNSGNLSNIVATNGWTFDAVLWTQNDPDHNDNDADDNQVCYASLFNWNNGSPAQVTSSQMSTASYSSMASASPHLISASFNDSASGFTNYGTYAVMLKSSASSRQCYLGKAGLWVQLNPLSAAEIIYRLEKQYDGMSTSVASSNSRILLDLSLFNGNLVNIFFEATGVTSGTSSFKMAIEDDGTSDSGTTATTGVTGCALNSSSFGTQNTRARSLACSGLTNGDRFFHSATSFSGSINMCHSTVIVDLQ